MSQATAGRVLRVATTMVAMDLTTFIADVSNEIASRMGAEVAWVPVPFETLFTEDHAPFDFAMQVITITTQRKELVDFSLPYMEVNQGVLVKTGSPLQQVRTVAALRSALLGAHGFTTGMECIRSRIRPSREPRDYRSSFEAARAVSSAEIDAAVFDSPIAIALARQFKNTTAAAQIRTREQYGLLFSKGSPLRERVDRILRDMMTSGLLPEIVERRFPGLAELPMLT